MLAQIETSKPYNARFKMLKPVIEKLCQLCNIEVDFVPYGLAGHVVGGRVQCRGCGLIFHARLSMCNETDVYCPHCMREHTVFTDGKTARVLVTLPVADPLTEGQ